MKYPIMVRVITTNGLNSYHCKTPEEYEELTNLLRNGAETKQYSVFEIVSTYERVQEWKCIQ